jgi:hypothetical protein
MVNGQVAWERCPKRKRSRMEESKNFLLEAVTTGLLIRD